MQSLLKLLSALVLYGTPGMPLLGIDSLNVLCLDIHVNNYGASCGVMVQSAMNKIMKNAIFLSCSTPFVFIS